MIFSAIATAPRSPATCPAIRLNNFKNAFSDYFKKIFHVCRNKVPIK
jgi:hypothetical protein